ncbi:MarR family transcriptional regulator [Brevundimonas sp.]|uniref:MarR family winged helix-turn-helix transcriptional regulator n=1 Tax=Brevundimonas sp. TaxID=1871086 RepID=UPI00341CA783
MSDSLTEHHGNDSSHETVSDLVMDQRAALQLLIKQRIGLISRRWTARAARLFKTYGYTSAQRAPLHLLKNAPAGLTQAELAGGLQLSEPTLSRRVARLLADGLVSKHRLQGDGRANLIKLEPAGHQALERSETTAARDRDLLFQGLTDEDLGVTLRVLDTLADRMAGPIETASEGGHTSA